MFIDSIIDEDTSIRTIVADMEKDTGLFMKLMNEANNMEIECDIDALFEGQTEVDGSTVNKVISNVRKYGSNYAKVLCYVNEQMKSNNNNNIIKENEIEEAKDTKSTDNDWFFTNIIFFTNETDSAHNKTLKNLEDAINGRNINLVTFCSDSVSYKATENSIDITDGKTSYKIKDQSNADTICIVRLGAQDNEQCISCIKEIQSWGIFTLNPIGAAQTASNKYETSVLLEKYNIPQPNFALLTKSDIDKGEESLINKLEGIYKGTKEKFNSGKEEDKKEIEAQEYVVKILDGHGGTGVFMLNGKSILAVLQAIFAIDEERELLLQKKEEADGGDIRVHVLSFNGANNNNKQEIVAAMKRVKLKGDFRSNVSLGATAEKVTLTKEQEEIAMNTAKISGMPWCAVDIMPLKKGSNPEIGDNVVLEYNASPGTDGISEVIGENFVSLLLNKINENKDSLPLCVKQIGFIEDIDFVLDNNEDSKAVKLDAKFDTGNGALASTLGCDSIEEVGDGKVKVSINKKEYIYDIEREISPKVGNGRETRRTVIIPEIIVGTRKLKNVEFGIVTTRDNKSTRVLINRDVMRKMGLVINPNLKNSL